MLPHHAQRAAMAAILLASASTAQAAVVTSFSFDNTLAPSYVDPTAVVSNFGSVGPAPVTVSSSAGLMWANGFPRNGDDRSESIGFTVSAAPGKTIVLESITFSFVLNASGSGYDGQLYVDKNGQQLYTADLPISSGSNWVFNRKDTLSPAITVSGADQVKFIFAYAGRSDTSPDQIQMDNILVEGVVPEPASLASVGAVAVGLLWRRRRRA